jgi:tyrosyl-tRNA synthetase
MLNKSINLAKLPQKLNLINTLKSRKTFAQMSHEDELASIISENKFNEILLDENKRPLCAYAGFDPTAKSLHLGNLAILMGLRRAQDCGFTPIILFGGATGLIGDPTGRTELRQMNSLEQINEFIENFKKLTTQYFNFDVPNKPIFVNNYDWVGPLKWIDFARNIGVHFTIAKLLAADANKTRFEAGGLTFLELGYQLLQAYDFLHLFENYNCILQIGGSDQWSNILAGADLIRRLKNKKAFALTLPLLVGSDGRKYGKSAGNATWLDSNMTSVYDFFQFLRNVNDNDIETLLLVFTLYSPEEIKEIISSKSVNDAKQFMAFEITKLVHGEKNAHQATESAKALFSGEGDLSFAPKLIITREEMLAGFGVLSALVKGGICSSNSEARKVVLGNGLTLNNNKVTDPSYKLQVSDFENSGEKAVLKKGKKDFLVLHLSSH